MSTNTTFKDYLNNAFENGAWASDDIIAFVKPLFEEVLHYHEQNKVAPFFNAEALFITDNYLDIDEKNIIAPINNINTIKAINKQFASKAFNIVNTLTLETNVDEGYATIEDDAIIFKPIDKPAKPIYTSGYISYEMLLNHHDAQTDIFCLGLILGSMALSLNLYVEDDLKTFVAYRKNPIQYNARIHPTISGLITEMTELNRHKRTQDLYDAFSKLNNYRAYSNVDFDDLTNKTGWIKAKNDSKNDYILNKLKNRLFDKSRRNRLLYYKPNARFVNLTVSSVPIVLNFNSIRPELLFVWNNEIKKKIINTEEILLNKYLRFEDHSYLPPTLDKIRIESNKDINEYGFSQLKMVIAFLNWHNVKENIQERIQSPLLLITATLKKIKKIKEDHYTLKVDDNIAEVNPVLANYLKDLYGIILPAFIDLDEVDIETFYQDLKQQIEGANQGIKLVYTNKPKIKLIHSIAKQTLSNYQRKLKNKAGFINTYKNLDYSYDQNNFKPLGLEIFKNKIEAKPSHLEFLINEDITLGSNHFADEAIKERVVFEMAESDDNAYSWDFDTCNIVLGNFNYKKMSLVRDYDFIIDNNTEHPVFNELFSNKPKEIKPFEFDINDIKDWHPIITADPTQTKSILYNRTGNSYIIQGPPGTGKSQTITNLIADYVANGKTVLFVCEKRAALDVVYHRLKQNELDELCCYIHDSQNDKRAFIQDLKKSYEDFLKNKKNTEAILLKRNEIVADISTQINVLKNYHQVNSKIDNETQCKTITLIENIIEAKENILPLSVTDLKQLPNYAQWQIFGEKMEALNNALEKEGCEDNYASHPFSKINQMAFKESNASNYIQQLIVETTNLLVEVEDFITAIDLPGIKDKSIAEIRKIKEDCTDLLPFITINKLDLIDATSLANKNLQTQLSNLLSLSQTIKKQEDANAHWTKKLSETDLATSLEIVKKRENNFFKFLFSDWKQVKKTINNNYNFGAHDIKPRYDFVLQQLQKEYDLIQQEEAETNKVKAAYKVNNISFLNNNLKIIQDKNNGKYYDYLLANNQSETVINSIVKKQYVLNNAIIKLKQLFTNPDVYNISTLKDDIDNIRLNLSSMANLLPALKDFATLPSDFQNAFSKMAINTKEAEATIAHEAFKNINYKNPAYADADFFSLQASVNKINTLYKALLKINALQINAKCRNKFLQNIDISLASVSNLNNELKAFKKDYAEGRRILENEFTKSMRFKSIRELSSKESYLVVKDLKPVWLMSPLSISDSLPLNTTYFDVVIFDEASQITVEEGIPALYRAPQTIIVGDDKQMPPTNYFNSKVEDPDDIIIEENEYDNDSLSMDADSLLVQGSKKLYSTMLCWHYRSTYETLISFSNHAFYNADLLTIPDIAIHNASRPDIVITDNKDAIINTNALFDRSISYHYMPNAQYINRTNNSEAVYIAEMVKALLTQNIKESIAIVAFSQEQQINIENALTTLASADKAFEELLELAYVRTEEEQFVGLIIKNLENIQGDERDIVIMSVCYGFDNRKKMIMNFGPINKKGGEKRLNVLFSRAKKHMAIISSIKHTNITNEYNEGANYFKQFLQYAENVSLGNMNLASGILKGMILKNNSINFTANNNIVAIKIKEALAIHNIIAEEQVGHSIFKCALAIKENNEDSNYKLGILIDDYLHYDNENILEQYYQRPAILESFGWRVMMIFSKDWLQNPNKVLGQILSTLKEINIGNKAEANEIKKDLNFELLQLNTELVSLENNDSNYYEFVNDNSSRFWSIGVHGCKMTTSFGKIGTKGQTQIKTFETNEKAIKEMEKMEREKINKGYIKKQKNK